MSLDTKRFAFIADALHGTGGFLDGGNLIPYQRETPDKLKGRKDLAWYQNHLAPACSRFVGYLNKKPPQREINHPLLEAFSQDCDWRGNSLDVFFSSFAIETKARGCGLLLVDMPSFAPENKAQQIETRFYPYLVSLKPEDVRSYALNQQGQLDSIEIESSMSIDGKVQTVIRGWDFNSWWVSLNGKVIEGSVHGLGVCPVLAFSEGDTFPYVGGFGQIADLSKRLYNLRSELDEILRGQTFSILTYQLPTEQLGQVNPANLAESVGTSNMLLYTGSNAPSFSAPPAAPAEIYIKTIEGIEARIREIGLTVELGGNSSSESGIALRIRFEALNAALATFARKMEDLERRMFDICSRWLGIQNQVMVSYSREYSLADVSSELQTLQLYQAAEFPTEVVNEKKKQIITLEFSNLEPDALQALLDSVDQVDPETPILESRLAVLEASIVKNSDSNFTDGEVDGGAV